jgi:nitrogen PTS system EIIA component
MLSLTAPLKASDKAPDDQPITRLIFFIAPSPRRHLELLARLSSALRDPALRKLVLENEAPEQIIAAVRQFDQHGAFGKSQEVRK